MRRTLEILIFVFLLGMGLARPASAVSSCTVDSDCDDSIPCTGDYCVQGTCRNYDSCGADCDYCPPEACNLATGSCELVDQTDPAEICGATGAAHCGVSADPCGATDCDVCGQVPICHSDGDCNDQDACTTDVCRNGVCDSDPIADCCQSENDCDDNVLCTANECVNHQCSYSPISNCCETAQDCDDGDACTADVCSSGQCVQNPIANCCHDDLECDDGNACTQDACANHACDSVPIADCTPCGSDADCAGGSCRQGVCVAPGPTTTPMPSPGPGASNCDDGNPCTVDNFDSQSSTCSHQEKADCVFCGNSNCENGENSQNCPQDCQDSLVGAEFGGGGGCSLRPASP